jgi:hypothetical protein
LIFDIGDNFWSGIFPWHFIIESAGLGGQLGPDLVGFDDWMLSTK